MKKLLATFLLLFAFTFLHAQNKAEIDSLLLVIDTLTNELDKAKNFRRLHELTMFTNPELARDYAQKALDISITNEDARGIASGYMQIGNYFTDLGIY
jgi:hypothetical protein